MLVRLRSLDFGYFGFEITRQPRALLPEMLNRAPSDLSTDGDMVPGDDLRSKGNSWLRSSFNHSGLKKAPREGQLRGIITKFVSKKKRDSQLKWYALETPPLHSVNLNTINALSLKQTDPQIPLFSPRTTPHWICTTRLDTTTGGTLKAFYNIKFQVAMILMILGGPLNEPSRLGNAMMYCWSIRRVRAGAGTLHLLVNQNPVGFLAPKENHIRTEGQKIVKHAVQTQNISVRVDENYHSPGLLLINWRRKWLTMMVKFQL